MISGPRRRWPTRPNEPGDASHSRPGRPRPKRLLSLQGDRGAGTAETVLAVPLLMLLILLIVQFAVWETGASVAQSAAEEALAAARVQGGTDQAGQQAAQQVIAEESGGTLADVTITVTRTADQVTVEISATAEQDLPFPGLTLRVSATAAGPVERFVADSREFSNSEGLPTGNLRVVICCA